MKVVILAGGLGTRLSEETEVKPKPLVEVGEEPILWHIMKGYRAQGFRDFYVALGYKGELIKRYFLDRFSLSGDIRICGSTGEVEREARPDEDWVVNLIETGKESNTGGRVKRMKPHVGNSTFMMTYGDGVSNVDLNALLEHHKKMGKIATITAVRPPARFGGLGFDGDLVVSFSEKPQTGEGWINGGFVVFEPAIFDYIPDDGTSLESISLERLAAVGQLAAYRHEGFWQCMDTLRDKRLLTGLWESGRAPWKTW